MFRYFTFVQYFRCIKFIGLIMHYKMIGYAMSDIRLHCICCSQIKRKRKVYLLLHLWTEIK